MTQDTVGRKAKLVGKSLKGWLKLEISAEKSVHGARSRV
jgi:hypothetical protein